MDAAILNIHLLQDVIKLKRNFAESVYEVRRNKPKLSNTDLHYENTPIQIYSTK